MHTPLGDHLAVEVASFFQKPEIRQQHRAAWSGSTFWLSATGQPLVVVSLVGLSLFMAGSSFCVRWRPPAGWWLSSQYSSGDRFINEMNCYDREDEWLAMAGPCVWDADTFTDKIIG